MMGLSFMFDARAVPTASKLTASSSSQRIDFIQEVKKEQSLYIKGKQGKIKNIGYRSSKS